MNVSAVIAARTGQTESRAGQPSNNLAPLLSDFFRALDLAGIPWAILRNAEGLPDDTRYDVDILIAPKDLPSVRQQLLQAALRHNWSVVGQIKKRHYLCLLLRSHGDDPKYLPVDLFSGLEYRGHPFANAAWGLQARERTDRDVWRVPLGFDAAVTVVKELLPHGVLKTNSQASVQHGACVGANSFAQALEGVLNPDLVNRMTEYCQRGEWEQLEDLTAEVRRGCRKWRFTSLTSKIDFLFQNLRHHRNRTVSSMVVLMAPDGSGKTTIAEALQERLHKKPFKACRYMRANFGILPELKSFKRRLYRLFGKDPRIPDPPPPGKRHSGMVQPHSAFRAMIYVLYYAIDLWIGRWKLVRMRAQWNLVIFDRYYFDYYFQCGHRHCPRWFLRLIERLVPQPDLAIFVRRDPDEIYRQKPELTIDEIHRQQGIIQEFLQAKPYGRMIDGNHGIQATVDTIVKEILQAVDKVS